MKHSVNSLKSMLLTIYFVRRLFNTDFAHNQCGRVGLDLSVENISIIQFSGVIVTMTFSGKETVLVHCHCERIQLI